MEPVIRKAALADIYSVAEIYNKIHTLEESGKISIGWNRKIYPTRETAVGALADEALYVMTNGGKTVASAIINQEQPSAYSTVDWNYPTPDNKVGVMHTLVIDPDYCKQGFAKLFVAFFENYCSRKGYEAVRLDTQVKNIIPFNMYLKLGYRLAGTKETKFQNLPGLVELAMFEKKLSE